MLPGDFTLLQVTPALDVGGVETLTVDMATAVAAAGARSLVASRGGRLEEELAWGGAELIRLPVDARNPWILAANAQRLERVIRAEKVSLVHVRSRAPAFSALWSARRAHVPIVATYHGIYAARSPLKRWYNRVMVRGDAVIANSAFTREHILSQHPGAAKKVVVIPEGVDISVFDPLRVSADRVAAVRHAWELAHDDRQIVLVAARLASWKGHSLAIEALARSGAGGKTRLVFVGRGEEAPIAADLWARAATVGVALHMVGPCDDMPAAYLAADVVAAPSTEPESFGRSVAEAGAMGRLVIASTPGGTAETVVDGQTGFLAPAGDVDAWAATLGRALAMSRGDRAIMGQAAWARVREHYSMAGMCEATFALYRRLCEKK